MSIGHPHTQRPFALITGASSGIGKAYAKALATRGYDLLLIARDREKLKHAADEISNASPVSVAVESLDLSLPGAAQSLYEKAQARRPCVDILINNAGFGKYGLFADMPIADIQRMPYLHVNAIIETTRLFLPDMIARRNGAIINVASLAGFFPMPYSAEYAATKAFLIAFSESLAAEVRPFGVTIQACCPGQTDTAFHATAGFRPSNPFPAQSPEQVVSVSLSHLNTKSPLVMIGWQGALSHWIARFLPRAWLARLAGARINLPSSKF